MEALSPTTSTNSVGDGEVGRGVVQSPEPEHPPNILRLARYIELVDADYLNDDLARTILATLNGPELAGLSTTDLTALQEPARKAARALCRWLISRPEVPITEIIKVVPRLRSMLPANAWVDREDVFTAVLDEYREAKRGFRLSSGPERTFEPWSQAAKRTVLNKFVVDGLRNGERTALDNLCQDIALIGSFFPFTSDPAELTSRMEGGGWYARLSPADLEQLACSLVRLAPIMSAKSVQHVLLILNFRASSSFSHNARVNNSIIVPLAHRLFALGLLEQAYTAVHWSLIFYGYRLTSEAEFCDWVDAFAASSAAAGRRLALPASRSPVALHRPMRLAFITRGGSVSTTAADHIIEIMKHLARDYTERFHACLYVFDTFDPEMEASCTSRGIDVRFIVDDGIGADRVTDKIVRLQHTLTADGSDVAIWTHAFDLAFLAFGMRLAPLQILFSQYLHPQPQAVEVDGYMTWGSPVLKQQSFNGRPWRVVPSALQFEYLQIDDEAIRRLRSSHAEGGAILAGTLARADKVGQPDYLTAVVTLLQRHPNLIFIWTGHNEHAEIAGTFDEAGVLKQTRFVGWVNTSHYVRVLDVLLDTFPLSNGITALQAMSCGTPIVSLNTPLSYVGRDIVPAFGLKEASGSRQARLASEITMLFGSDDTNAIPAGRGRDDYINKASRLIDDAEFRARHGAAWKRTYELIYADEKLMANVFVDQLLEIVDEHAPLMSRK